ncbi:hypothetical protein [Streptomyces sp. NPDC020965]|uniref:hypothetical protein n=1 Tax=Streptomyces sp. NPDC020965 TaxID=3365105 RepID=UPI00378B8080
MISSYTSFVSAVKMTDHSVVASACPLGLAASFNIFGNGTGMSGSGVELPLIALGGLPVLERNERPTKALAAGVAKAEVKTYAFAAASADTRQQTQHHKKWAFRGLEPWSDPA